MNLGMGALLRYTEGISGMVITPSPVPLRGYVTDNNNSHTITGRENGKTKTIANAASAVRRILTPLTDGERDSYAAARNVFVTRARTRGRELI